MYYLPGITLNDLIMCENMTNLILEMEKLRPKKSNKSYKKKRVMLKVSPQITRRYKILT